MVKEMEVFNSPLTKILGNKLKPLMANHSENYARYLLSYNSTKFMVSSNFHIISTLIKLFCFEEFWLTIKKLSANEINSDKKYSKASFNKILKASFGNVY